MYSPPTLVVFGPPTLKEYIAKLCKTEDEVEEKKKKRKEYERTMYEDMSYFYEPRSLIEHKRDEMEPCHLWDEEKSEWIDQRPAAMREVHDQMYIDVDDEISRHLYVSFFKFFLLNFETINSFLQKLYKEKSHGKRPATPIQNWEPEEIWE